VTHSRRLLFTLTGLLLISLACTLPAQSVQHITVASRDVALWKPAGPAPTAGYPVIVFSHGFTGCNTQSGFLMEAFARAGYFVLAPNHDDARCGTARNHSLTDLHPEQPFKDETQWSDETYKIRAADIRAVLDAALREKSFEGVPVDSTRIGIAGHSLGGYTALGMAGAWPSRKDARFKAVLALSPFCTPYIAKGDLGHLKVPVMYQGGTLDFGITPTVRRLSGAYDRSSAPKYYVEFKGAGHLAWTSLNKAYQEIISSYSVAFFDRWLKGAAHPDPLAPVISKPWPDRVSFVKFDLK